MTEKLYGDMSFATWGRIVLCGQFALCISVHNTVFFCESKAHFSKAYFVRSTCAAELLLTEPEPSAQGDSIDESKGTDSSSLQPLNMYKILSDNDVIHEPF